MSLGYSRGNPPQYIIQVLNRVEALKCVSPAELSFKIAIKAKFLNSQPPTEPEDFELQIPSEDETFFPNGVQNFNL